MRMHAKFDALIACAVINDNLLLDAPFMGVARWLPGRDIPLRPKEHNCWTLTVHHAKGVIMIADILTKGVARPIFIQLLRLLDEYAVNSVIELSS